MWRRPICLLAAAALCCTLAGCAARAGAPGSSESLPAGQSSKDAAAGTLSDYDFVLPWYSKEGYNPYLSDNSLTLQLSDLLFEKMVVINPQFTLEYGVLSGVQVSGLDVTLMVDRSYTFSDGTAVSAYDVAASLEAARTSPAYGARFANVTQVTVSDDATVLLTLKEPDALFAWLLDIPVLPAGETNAAQPRASGRYTYSADGGLEPNPNSRQAAPFSHITLGEMTGADALANSLNIGAISLYSSEAEGLANGIYSSRQASYYTNTLVFLGFNSIASRTWSTADVDGVLTWHTVDTGSAPLLASVQGRQAVNDLLDRTSMLEKVYYNQGHIATGYFNTVGPASGGGTLSGTASPDAAAAALAALGCTKGTDGYYHYPGDGAPDKTDRVSLRLLVYTGSSYKRYLSQLVAQSLGEAGIEVQLSECDTLEAYTQKIAALDFDLYIGEIKLYNNMDLSAFLADGGAAAAGLSASDGLREQYAQWRAGALPSASLEAALAAEMPWAPLAWRSGTLYYAKALEGFDPAVSSVFYHMENLRLS